MDLRGQSETLCVLGATGSSPVIKEAHMLVCVVECVLYERIWVVPQEYLLSHCYGAGVFFIFILIYGGGYIMFIMSKRWRKIKSS